MFTTFSMLMFMFMLIMTMVFTNVSFLFIIIFRLIFSRIAFKCLHWGVINSS
jgi:hypothetical protein